MIYLYLFITFFEIGIFGFGGGYGMLSLIQGEVVHHWHWMTTGEFTDIVAISQMTPGPVGINSATYCGYTAAINAGYSVPMGILGSFVATFALVLPSFILMILIAKMFMKYMHTSTVQSIFEGLRPAVVGDQGQFQFLCRKSLAILHQHFPLRRHFRRHLLDEDQSHPHDYLFGHRRTGAAVLNRLFG